MSLTLSLKKIYNLGGKYDRLVSITFRGYTYSARRPQCEYEAIINEEFTWPHYGKDIAEEMLEIKVYNHSKIFSNRLLGYMRISLQQVTKTGRLILREALVDKNNSLTDILVDLEIRYQPVEGAVGTWTENDYVIDMNEGSFTIKNKYAEGSSTDLENAEQLDRKTRSLGRKLVNDNDDDGEDEDDVDISEIDISSISFTPQKSRSRFFTKADLHTPIIQNFQIAVTITEARKLIGVNIDPVVYVKVGEEKKRTATQKSTNCPFYNEYFVFEFQEPAAVLFDKIIEIIVVHAKKIPFTGVQLGLFRIDAGTVYQQTDHGFYHKWAILTDPKDTKSGIKGFVKCTITVFGKGDSQGGVPGDTAKADEDVEKNLLLPKQVPLERPWAKFYIRLYKAEDLPSMNSGFMGSISKILGEQKIFIDPYIQVTFAGQQGETSVESNTTNPEWNEQITFVEMFPPLARRIKIQVIDDANINGVAIATHFINLQQISDPRINAGFYPTFGPAWVYLYGSPQNSALRDAYKDLNDGLGEGIFYRGRILMAVSVDIYSSITAIQSDKGKKSKSIFKFKKKSKKSKSKSKAKEESHSQTEGEEAANALEQPSAMEVSVDGIHPLPESAAGEKEEFLLFAGFFEATMIDPSVQSRLLTFEVSIGNCGKLVEVVTKKKKEEKVEETEEKKSLLDSRDSEDELENNELCLFPKDNSITPPRKAENTEYDRSYCCISYLYEKPCVYIWSSWEDYSWRLYNSNVLAKIAERLEDGLDQLLHMVRKPKSDQENSLCKVLNEFVAGCRQYHIYAEKKTMNRPNGLDRCRIKTLKCNVINYAKQALKIMKEKEQNVMKKLNKVQQLMERFKTQVEEPQTPIPDIFIWMLSNGKRVAVARVPARQILYSVVEEENGRDCGKIQSIIMKAPGAPIGEIFAKLEIYMWLGATKSTKSIMNHLPMEYLPVYDEEARKESPRMLPPIKLSSDCELQYKILKECMLCLGQGGRTEWCVWMFKVGNTTLISSCALTCTKPEDCLQPTRLDYQIPFQELCFQLSVNQPEYKDTIHASRTSNAGRTQQAIQHLWEKYIEETLSPMWCEMLLFDQILIEGSKDELKNDPPIIIINIFDFNSFGSPEFLGRTFAVPQIKLQEEKYEKPTLGFHDIYKGKTRGGELLAAFELIELDYSGYGEPSLPKDVESRIPEFLDVQEKHFIIPKTIRPTLKKFRIEVLFWGLRDLKRINLFEVEQPQVMMECGGQKVESEVIANYKENPNFTELIKYFEVDLPEDMNLHPPLSIVVVEQRAFGRMVLVGSYTVTSLQQFSPVELKENPNPKETAAKNKRKASTLPQQRAPSQAHTNIEMGASTNEIKKGPLTALTRPMKKLAPKSKSEGEHEEFEEKIDLEELDWWSKYYASLEEMKNEGNNEDEEEDADFETETINPSASDVAPTVSREQQNTNTRTQSKKTIATFQIYKELEKEYNNFQDWLYIFPLYRGKANEDEFEENVEDRVMGKCKGSLLIYPNDEVESGFKILKGKPTNRPVKVLVRVYVVKATNLAPSDPNGKSDPYIVVKIGEQMQDSAERYIPKQLNPVFGEVFEMTVAFPVETELTVSIFDHDMVGKDDLIGETKLDLENRYYSRHRAQCGLPTQYDIEGYNAWRDCLKPTQILTKLCKDLQLPEPEYRLEEVKVSNKIFKMPIDLVPIGEIKKGEQPVLSNEQKALYVLNHWEDMPEHSFKMVPEHLEIRNLQTSDNPGMLQGQVHMWVDMFPVDLPAPPPVNIKPRQPISYEMRVIIWNTDDVPLDDVNPLTGVRSSDIYIKGWLKGLENDKQETDVHFNSLTGEGNFNWRFVFRFDYLPTEKEIVYKKKESIFSLEESEFRQPAVLMLQIWDYDLISANDFLGSVELKLNDMVRPSKTADQCTIKMAKQKAGPRASIIKGKRMKGWWPMIKVKEAEDEEEEDDESKKKKKKKKKKKVKIEDVEFTDSSGNVYILRGKVEAELHLLTVEEAEKSPVGLGRKEPEPLDKPNRPNTSFNWFVNPLKSFVYFIWKNYKWYIIGLLVIVILALFIFLILYTMPQFISEKIING